VTEIHLFLVATGGLLACAAIRTTRIRWRTMKRVVTVLALLCLIGGLALSAVRRGNWPLGTAAEWIVAAAGAAILWRLLDERSYDLPWGGLTHLLVATLLVWGVVRWPSAQTTSAVRSEPQIASFASNLTLALACGAFVEAGSLALACLFAEIQAHRPCGASPGCHAVWIGLPSLTASLLLSAIAGLYTRGVYWEWSVSESWRLLAWFFYAVLWCASILLRWRGRWLWALTTLGIIPTLLVLAAR
jgi:hypothetical protein